MKPVMTFVALASLLLLTAAALAQTDGNDLADLGSSLQASANPTYRVNWYTVDGGGATFSTGNGFTLGGTIGQADAGLLAGHGYALRGGFWAGVLYRQHFYLPVALRNGP